MAKEPKSLLVEALLESSRAVDELSLATSYKRRVWHKLNQQLQDFLAHGKNRWLVLPGIRGIGKTTLLGQLYRQPNPDGQRLRKFYFSIDKLALMGASMNDFVEAIKYLRRSYPDDPFLLLVDEVHFDSQWSLGFKIIFDQVPKTLLICTGSSALSLRLSPDSARRVDLVKISPLGLDEFAAIAQISFGIDRPISPPTDLNQQLKAAIFDSASILEAYSSLANCQTAVANYYRSLAAGLNSTELIDQYINGYGTLPFFADYSLGLSRSGQPIRATDPGNDDTTRAIRGKILAAIEQTLLQDTVKLMAGRGDRSQLGFQLQAATIDLLPQLVSILANSERISLAKIGKQLGNTHQKTLKLMLRVLVASEMIIEIPPIGASLARNTKTPKYLFATPALRQALVPSSLPLVSTDGSDSGLRGRLLEDTVVMYLERLFGQPGNHQTVEYDSRSRGADFVISPSGMTRHAVAIEVGQNKKTAGQVSRTLGRSGRYGLVITNLDEPRLDTENNAVFLPLSYFLLI